jgi:outer membrane protein OmpA-like peptidoglycan-associated protein
MHRPKCNDDYNQDLSERRANAVKTYLVQNFQVNGDRLASKGFGKTQPIASNTKSDGSDDPEGRQKNRRVEVIIHNTAP